MSVRERGGASYDAGDAILLMRRFDRADRPARRGADVRRNQRVWRGMSASPLCLDRGFLRPRGSTGPLGSFSLPDKVHVHLPVCFPSFSLPPFLPRARHVAGDLSNV